MIGDLFKIIPSAILPVDLCVRILRRLAAVAFVAVMVWWACGGAK